MATRSDFEGIKSITERTKHIAHGYIRECQKLFIDEDNPYYIIPQLIYIMVLLFFDDPEYFTINEKSKFEYIHKEHGNYYHIYGNKRIKRNYTKQYEWKVKVGPVFKGRFGILNDIPSTYENIMDDSCYWRNIEIINIGAREGYHIFGRTGDRELASFIASADTIIINIDFEEDTISFESTARQADDYDIKPNKPTKVVRDLKKGTDTVRFCAELTWSDSTIEFVK